jgi:hypothetical protein
LVGTALHFFVGKYTGYDLRFDKLVYSPVGKAHTTG